MNKTPRLVEIKQGRPGFDQFINAWLCSDEMTVVVDVGPANSAERLLAALDSLKVDRIDYVLLTHIHLDHAGGLAPVLARYPEAKAVCHAKGLKFLIDPAKLWAGSLQVLGEVAELYGPPQPVPAERLIPHDQAELPGLTIIETPGHAPHHLSFHWRGRLFAGEAGGTFCRVQGREYLRAATPPRFFLPETLASVDRLLALDDQPIYYGHFGQAESSHLLLTRFRRQLFRWQELIGTEMNQGRQDDIEERCLSALLSQDPELDAYKMMDAGAQERERFLIANSVRGYIGYLTENKIT